MVARHRRLGDQRPRRRSRQTRGPEATASITSCAHGARSTTAQAFLTVGTWGGALPPTSTRRRPLTASAAEPSLLHILRRVAAGGLRAVVRAAIFLPEPLDE